MYKQLYRAAKAKLKLRIKATITDASSPDHDSATTPSPLSAHCFTPSKDASIPSLESTATDQHLLSGLATSTTDPTVGVKSSPSLPLQFSKPALRSKLPYDPCSSPSVTAMGTTSLLDTANPVYESMSSHAKMDYQMQLMLLEQQNKKRLLMARQEQDMYATALPAGTRSYGSEAPVPRSFTARDDLIPELASLSMDGPKDSAAKPKPSPAGGYSVCCNKCQATISNSFWHCGICNGDDFDLCQNCVEKGFLCEGDDHWLIKRTIKNGEIISSTTETIAPKKVPKAVSVQNSPEATTPPKEEDKVADKPQDLSMYRTCNSCVEGEWEIAHMHSGPVTDRQSL